MNCEKMVSVWRAECLFCLCSQQCLPLSTTKQMKDDKRERSTGTDKVNNVSSYSTAG